MYDCESSRLGGWRFETGEERRYEGEKRWDDGEEMEHHFSSNRSSARRHLRQAAIDLALLINRIPYRSIQA